jgi:hypothetical protein
MGQPISLCQPVQKSPKYYMLSCKIMPCFFQYDELSGVGGRANMYYIHEKRRSNGSNFSPSGLVNGMSWDVQNAEMGWKIIGSLWILGASNHIEPWDHPQQSVSWSRSASCQPDATGTIQETIEETIHWKMQSRFRDLLFRNRKFIFASGHEADLVSKGWSSLWDGSASGWFLWNFRRVKKSE